MITGKDLKEARQRKHLSQEEVAELSGYSVRQISRMENDINIGQLQRNVELLACLVPVSYTHLTLPTILLV